MDLDNDAVAALVQAGHLARGTDPTDGRRTLVTLTETGRALVDHAHAASRADLDAAFAGLTAPEQEAITAALPALEHIATLLADR